MTTLICDHDEGDDRDDDDDDHDHDDHDDHGGVDNPHGSGGIGAEPRGLARCPLYI